MKKIIGIALALAVIATLGFSSLALADPPKAEVKIIGGENPDVTVTAYKGPAGVYQWDGTAQFTLKGTGSVTGVITADYNGVFECYTDYTGQPQVGGWYTAAPSYTDEGELIPGTGNFKSTFSANSYMLDGPSYFGHGTWSEHSIDATGLADEPIIIDPGTGKVTGGGLTVTGGAIAFASPPTDSSYGGFVEGWQAYDGEAEEVTVSGSKMDSTKQGIDPATWDSADYTGGKFTATATGSPTVSFIGRTEAGTYPSGIECGCPGRVLSKQGLGFDIEITGSSIGTESDPARLWTKYPYANMLACDAADNCLQLTPTFDSGLAIITAFNADKIVGETSTPFTGTPGSGYYEWTGVPGYILP